MKKNLFIPIVVIFFIAFSCQKTENVVEVDKTIEAIQSFEEIIPNQYIVIFEKTGLKSARKDKVFAEREVLSKAETAFTAVDVEMPAPTIVYSAALQGVVVNMSENEAEKLMGAQGVAGVYPDKMVTLKRPAPEPDPDPDPSQTVPPGITRVGGANYTGSHVAWIIDTGIDLDHPDLNVDNSKGYLAAGIRSNVGFDDDNGHGTHCAGIVAAVDNDYGVVGVAAGATVVPVKVLDKRGSGAYSSIIDGIEYVAANAAPGDAANMSLGGGVYEPIDAAVVALGEAGIFVAMAAGNESDDANNHSPARTNGDNLYTVSAMDVSDVWDYFSNYGNPPVDYCAPGVSILSTYKGGAYASMSGTSMASPHVCGILLMTNGNPNTDGAVTGDPDGNADPIAHN